MLVILKEEEQERKNISKVLFNWYPIYTFTFPLIWLFFISFHPSIEKLFYYKFSFLFLSFLFFLSSFWIYKLGPFPVEHLSTNQNIQIPFYNFNFKFNLRFPILFSFRLFIYFYLDLSLVFFFFYFLIISLFSQFGIINCISCPFNNNNTYN